MSFLGLSNISAPHSSSTPILALNIGWRESFLTQADQNEIKIFHCQRATTMLRCTCYVADENGLFILFCFKFRFEKKTTGLGSFVSFSAPSKCHEKFLLPPKELRTMASCCGFTTRRFFHSRKQTRQTFWRKSTLN